MYEQGGSRFDPWTNIFPSSNKLTTTNILSIKKKNINNRDQRRNQFSRSIPEKYRIGQLMQKLAAQSQNQVHVVNYQIKTILQYL